MPLRSGDGRRAADTAVRMPDFCSPRRGVRQTVDAALASLEQLGVEPDRVVLRAAGAGWVTGTVVGQVPAPGVQLTPETRVELDVAGTGALESLPYPLREDSDDAMRVDALFALFDAPILRVRHAVRQAGGFSSCVLTRSVPRFAGSTGSFAFRRRPGPRGVVRSGAAPSTLHRVAGRAEAIPLALELVFGLPVARVQVVSGIAELAELWADESRVREQPPRPGCGARCRLAGDHRDRDRDRSGERRNVPGAPYGGGACGTRRDLPARATGASARAVRERWTVGTPANPPRLQDGWQPAALGLNSYLGGRVLESRSVE
jgi:hypothetical protein